MGFRIIDLQGATLPLTGSEIIELEQAGASRKVQVSDLLPGFEDQLRSDLANKDEPDKGAGQVGYRGRTAYEKLSEEVSARDFGAAGDGVADDTAAVQAAIDHAFVSGGRVIVPAGTYAVTGVKVYGVFADNAAGTLLSGRPTVLEFMPGAVFKMTAATGFVIRSAESPTQTRPTDELLYGQIINPVIDMDSKGWAAILLECAHYWNLFSPDIRNVPAGTFSYDDGYTTNGVAPPGPRTYPKTGVMIKGITGIAGAYHNEVVRPFIRGASDGVRGQCGIWMSATGDENNQRANFNQISQGTLTWLVTGLDVEQGFNQNISMLNIFSCNDAMRINTGRNHLLKPYIESCDRGIYYTLNSGFNALLGLSSVASTTTPIDDQGIDNFMYPEDNFPRFGAMATSGAGTSGQVVANSTWAKVAFDSSILTQTKIASITDTTNSRFTIDSDGDGEGLYLIIGTVRISPAVDGSLYELSVYKNGVQIFPYAGTTAGSTTAFNLQVVSYAYLQKNDYIEIWIRQGSGGNLTLSDSVQNQFFVVKQHTNIGKPINR